MANNKTKKSELDAATFVKEMYGEDFKGFLSLWSKQTKRTKFYPSSAMQKLLDDIADLKDREDLYLGLSTQKEDVGPKKRGSADTIVTFPGFFADLDFANDKDSKKNYPPDEKTTLKILADFEFHPTQTQISGNGAHAFWILDKPFVCKNRKDRRRAQAASKKFQAKIVAHFRKHGYEIDSVGDTVRLYRIPGTYNHKSNPPKPVTAIIYDPQKRVSVEDAEALAANDKVEDKPEEAKEFAPANHGMIAKECAWYGHMTGEGAAECSEPDWHGVASITRCCKGGEETFHDYSAKHPEYNQREAQAKYDRASKAGPRTCAAIKDDLGNTRFCDECQHAGRIKSPVQLGHGYDPGIRGRSKYRGGHSPKPRA